MLRTISLCESNERVFLYVLRIKSDLIIATGVLYSFSGVDKRGRYAVIEWEDVEK